MDVVRLVAFSDYLCPWCYNASVRLEKLVAEFPGEVELEWRSFLLRPTPQGARDPEKFRAYTESWRRPAAEEDAGRFRVWASEAPPPSHSVPPHLLAKAAAELGEEPFERVHRALLAAYFGENRDVSDAEVLAAIWREVGLPEAELARREDPALLRRVLGEHEQAIELGVTGVPAVMRADQKLPLVGALPTEMYRQWVRRSLAESA